MSRCGWSVLTYIKRRKIERITYRVRGRVKSPAWHVDTGVRNSGRDAARTGMGHASFCEELVECRAGNGGQLTEGSPLNVP